MKIFIVSAFLAAIFLGSADCKNWALIVAGSSGYDNYRHQADICHAYHVLRSHGVAQENIVTMMYDDIAYSEENPYQGNIINQPDGPNVFPGVLIDYKKQDVTPQVFLAVLSGDKEKVQELTGHDGRVIESGPDDHVFVNFADHGGPGLLAFPDSILHAKDLEKTLMTMHKKNQYKKMVLYVEACESGSMFATKLPKDINIYAATASSPNESSYACYFDEKRQTYLGDVFSVNWMQDSDKENLETEILQKQYLITKKETNTSEVEEYGDLSITKMTVAEFQGNQASFVRMPPSPRHPTEDAVPAPEVPMKILEHKLKAATTYNEKRKVAQAITDLMAHYTAVDGLFQSLVGWMEKNSMRWYPAGGMLTFRRELSYKTLAKERRPITQWGCYEQAVDELANSCQNLKLHQDYYALQQLFVLVNLCERGYDGKDVRLALLQAIKDHPRLCAN
ncbi:hypothetical protein V1264_019109 [Littorina saxatilis]